MLTIKDLTVKFPSRFGDFSAIEGVDMTSKPGEIHGLVGESGCGKTTLFSLFQQLYPIKKGGIFIGRYNMNEINKKDFRSGLKMFSKSKNK